MKVKREKHRAAIALPGAFFACVGRGAAGMSGRKGEIRRRECEDFAPQNGGTRPSGERGAKRGGRRARGGAKSGGGNVKILLPGTEAQGLAGSGEQREEAAGRAEWRNPVAEM